MACSRPTTSARAGRSTTSTSISTFSWTRRSRWRTRIVWRTASRPACARAGPESRTSWCTWSPPWTASGRARAKAEACGPRVDGGWRDSGGGRAGAALFDQLFVADGVVVPVVEPLRLPKLEAAAGRRIHLEQDVRERGVEPEAVGSGRSLDLRELRGEPPRRHGDRSRIAPADRRRHRLRGLDRRATADLARDQEHPRCGPAVDLPAQPERKRVPEDARRGADRPDQRDLAVGLSLPVRVRLVHPAPLLRTDAHVGDAAAVEVAHALLQHLETLAFEERRRGLAVEVAPGRELGDEHDLQDLDRLARNRSALALDPGVAQHVLLHDHDARA